MAGREITTLNSLAAVLREAAPVYGECASIHNSLRRGAGSTTLPAYSETLVRKDAEPHSNGAAI